MHACKNYVHTWIVSEYTTTATRTAYWSRFEHLQNTSAWKASPYVSLLVCHFSLRPHSVVSSSNPSQPRCYIACYIWCTYTRLLERHSYAYAYAGMYGTQTHQHSHRSVVHSTWYCYSNALSITSSLHHLPCEIRNGNNCKSHDS